MSESTDFADYDDEPLSKSAPEDDVRWVYENMVRLNVQRSDAPSPDA